MSLECDEFVDMECLSEVELGIDKELDMECLSEVDLGIDKKSDSGGGLSIAPEEKDGVYIVRSIDFFFLVTVRLTGVDVVEKTSQYEINCVPTPSENANVHGNIPTRPCVETTVIIGGNEPSKLDILRYDKTCSLVGPLQKKTGTAQMLMSTLAFAAKTFDQYVFHFTDASSVACGDVARVSLRDYGILVDGKTWYERAFGATPASDKMTSALEKYPTQLQTRMSEGQSNWLIETLHSQNLLSKNNLDLFTRTLRECARAGNTWRQTLNKIAKYENHGCSFFSYDIVEAITTLLQLAPVLNWRLEITDEKVAHFLKASEKIY